MPVDFPPSAGWRDFPRYPDPAVEVLDPRFAPIRIFSAAVERLYTGCRWAEGPVWIGDGRYLLWSDNPNDRILKWSILIALIGFALAWITASGIPILIGMFITGIGIGVHWPLGVARAVAASGGRTDRASALTSVFGSVAIALAPFALGAHADATDFHLALLLVPTMLIVALVVLVAKPVDQPLTSQPEPAR
jgi:MFS family permease